MKGSRLNPYLIQYPFDEVRAVYPSAVVRVYCLLRMHILRQRILAEIGQYIPHSGNVAEFGCGFGLFSLCIASTRPDIHLHACDLSAGRIQMAEDAAAKLAVENVSFQATDARSFVAGMPALSCAYMFDLLHHMPRAAVPDFVRGVWDKIEPGGIMIVKDVDTRPLHKMIFTYVLDVLMTRGERPEYWSLDALLAQFAELGGDTRVHILDDYLPFPHRLYAITKAR